MKSIGAVAPNKSSTLEAAIALEPTLVGIMASKMLQMYTSGILDTDQCQSPIYQYMLGVGYGTSSSGQEYYILKNSWSTSWGEQGYMKIAAKADGAGVCGV